VAPRVPRRRGCASASSYGFWPFTEFPEVACPSSCATALATRDPGRNRSNMTLDRDQSRIGADVRAVRPHNLLPNCLDRCSFCAPCLSSCQQIRAARLRHPCCGQATVAAAKKAPTPRGAQELRGIHGAVTGAICVSLVRPFYDRLRAARWRAVIQCAISRAPSSQDIGSTVSLYRSEFLDCVAGAGSE
jgi:hypothetical protein